jgi:hypothetical protein
MTEDQKVKLGREKGAMECTVENEMGVVAGECGGWRRVAKRR